MTTFRPRRVVVPTHDQEQIILGSLLGDGTLGNPRRTGSFINSHLRVTHTVKQSKYIHWKRDMLLPFSYPVHSVQVKENRGKHWGHSTREVLYFNCASHEYFTSLRKTWYPQDKKVFSLENVIHLDWLGLAVWYMDDGTYGWSKGSPYGFFCTEGFGIDVQLTIRDFLVKYFGIPCSVVSTGHGLKKIRISAAGIRILQDKLESLVIPSMKYKLGC